MNLLSLSAEQILQIKVPEKMFSLESFDDKDFALYGNDNNGRYTVKKITAMTHIDQLQEYVDVKANDLWREMQTSNFLLEIERRFNIISKGPTREDVLIFDY